MTVSRWKIMACTLGLSLGGLAICAGQSSEKLNMPHRSAEAIHLATEPAPLDLPVSNKPASLPTAPATLPPLVEPVATVVPIEPMVPNLVPVSDIAVPAAPLIAVEHEAVPEPVKAVHEMLPMPRAIGQREDPLIVDVDLALPVDRSPPPAVAPMSLRETTVVAPPAPEVLEPTAPAPVNPPAVGQIAPPVTVVETPLPMFKGQPNDPPPLIDVAPPAHDRPADSAPRVTSPDRPRAIAPAKAQVSVPPPAMPASPSKLKMLMRLGDGKPRFEIRQMNGEDLLLKVYGEKIEMQSPADGLKASPIAGVTASGQVRFVGPGIQGTCDQLSVLSGTGEVMLKGNVLLKTKRGKTWSELTADKMIYQIGSSGASSSHRSNPVSPVNYKPMD